MYTHSHQQTYKHTHAGTHMCTECSLLLAQRHDKEEPDSPQSIIEMYFYAKLFLRFCRIQHESLYYTDVFGTWYLGLLRSIWLNNLHPEFKNLPVLYFMSNILFQSNRI